MSENNKNNDKQVKTITLVLLLLSILALTIGSSFAFFQYVLKGNTVNYIETGDVIFAYNEGKDVTNGIKIADALPVSDTEGKVLSAPNQTFDFQILSNIANTPIEYQVVAQTEADSTLSSNYVKVYLTSLTGGIEEPVLGAIKGNAVIKYSELLDTDFPGQTGKVIYRETMNLAAGQKYSKSFRLRMWIAADTNINNADYMNKRFSIKVNTFATSL